MEKQNNKRKEPYLFYFSKYFRVHLNFLLFWVNANKRVLLTNLCYKVLDFAG